MQSSDDSSTLIWVTSFPCEESRMRDTMDKTLFVISIASDELTVAVRAQLGGENSIGRRASQHEEFEALGSFLLPCAVTRVSLLAVWCLLGATPRG